MLKQRLDDIMEQNDLPLQRRVAYASLYFTQLNDYETADSIYSTLYQQNPYNGQIVGALLRIYEDQEKWQEAVSVLERWIQANPNDQNAQNMLQQYRKNARAQETAN
jgi:lipopolysaccharide biosynthesis regulator YciM